MMPVRYSGDATPINAKWRELGIERESELLEYWGENSSAQIRCYKKKPAAATQSRPARRMIKEPSQTHNYYAITVTVGPITMPEKRTKNVFLTIFDHEKTPGIGQMSKMEKPILPWSADRKGESRDQTPQNSGYLSTAAQKDTNQATGAVQISTRYIYEANAPKKPTKSGGLLSEPRIRAGRGRLP